MLVVNLYGGPGSGKSTTAAGVFSKLKIKGINAELVTEYAKDKVWDKHFSILDNQIYIFGKQYHKLFRLIDQVDVVVTDSPLLLSIIYNQREYKKEQDALVLKVMDSFRCMNVFLNRVKVYNPKGRVQDEEGARKIDLDIKNMLKEHKVIYNSIDGDEFAVDGIVSDVLRSLKRSWND